MGWFQETLLGHVVTPRHKKVKTYLKEGFQYEVSSTLEPVFINFVEQQKSLGMDVDMTAVLFMAVMINSLENDESLEQKRFVYEKNNLALAGLPFHTKAQEQMMPWREIKDLYIEVSAKILPQWLIDELWSETNNNSLLLYYFNEIKEKDLTKINEFLEYGS